MKRIMCALLASGVCVIVAQCGGRIALGFFDSDGGFHAPDGALEFAPGSACVGYDAGIIASTTGQWQTGSVTTSIACDAANQCASVVPKNVAEPAYVGSGNVTYQLWLPSCNGTCAFEMDYTPPCTGADSSGDAYCRAFYQQFVSAPGATALASCKPYKNVVPHNHGADGDFMCSPDCCNYAGFCVQRGDANPTCEIPCQP